MFAFKKLAMLPLPNVVIESSSFDEEEVLTTQIRELLKLWHPKTQFRKLIGPQIDRANNMAVT